MRKQKLVIFTASLLVHKFEDTFIAGHNDV